jgi:dolichol-phosphate mannosyltransferase
VNVVLPQVAIDLSVVLPAYEEAENLALLLPALRRTLDSKGVSYEILVLDAEAPRDRTPEICAENDVRCIPRLGGPLYGHAIRTAQTAARGHKVIMMDADGSHPPEFVAELWAERDAADLVIASRYVQGGRTENPVVLIFLSQFVNAVFRLVLGLRVADVSNSFRLYRGDDLRRLKLECDNFDIVEEILVRLYAAQPNYRVREIPFTFGQRQAGNTKRNLVSFALGYLATLWRLWSMKREAK